MAFNIKASLDGLLNKLLASGYFPRAQIGEFKSPPGDQFAAAMWMDSVSINGLTLAGETMETHVITLRIYRNAMKEPIAGIEIELAKTVQKVMEDIVGEYDLGATIREVDVGGINGTGVNVRFGYTDVGGTMFRVADITVPLNVDGSATAAP